MLRRTGLFLVIVLLTVRTAGVAQAPLRMVVNADLGVHAISRHIYGHFAEHLGRRHFAASVTRDGPLRVRRRFDPRRQRISIPRRQRLRPHHASEYGPQSPPYDRGGYQRTERLARDRTNPDRRRNECAQHLRAPERGSPGGLYRCQACRRRSHCRPARQSVVALELR